MQIAFVSTVIPGYIHKQNQPAGLAAPRFPRPLARRSDFNSRLGLGAGLGKMRPAHCSDPLLALAHLEWPKCPHATL